MENIGVTYTDTPDGHVEVRCGDHGVLATAAETGTIALEVGKQHLQGFHSGRESTWTPETTRFEGKVLPDWIQKVADEAEDYDTLDIADHPIGCKCQRCENDRDFRLEPTIAEASIHEVIAANYLGGDEFIIEASDTLLPSEAEHEFAGRQGGAGYYGEKCSCGWTSNLLDKVDAGTGEEWQRHVDAAKRNPTCSTCEQILPPEMAGYSKCRPCTNKWRATQEDGICRCDDKYTPRGENDLRCSNCYGLKRPS